MEARSLVFCVFRVPLKLPFPKPILHIDVDSTARTTSEVR